jgi:hypothetical protein
MYADGDEANELERELCASEFGAACKSTAFLGVIVLFIEKIQ